MILADRVTVNGRRWGRTLGCRLKLCLHKGVVNSSQSVWQKPGKTRCLPGKLTIHSGLAGSLEAGALASVPFPPGLFSSGPALRPAVFVKGGVQNKGMSRCVWLWVRTEMCCALQGTWSWLVWGARAEAVRVKPLGGRRGRGRGPWHLALDIHGCGGPGIL